MKRARLIKLCYLSVLFIGFAAWTINASGQETKHFEKYMPLLKGAQWQRIEPDTKVAFIWGAAHVVLIEKILMEDIPELKRDSFVTKVVEARAAKVSAGTSMTINEVVSTIDQYYKDHPDQLETPVMRVIWDVIIKPNIKTGIAGRPLK
jgi:hypothetical protein